MCDKIWAANQGALLASLPPYLASQYPVVPKYTQGNQYIEKSTTNMMDELMLAYSNGGMFSKLLYKAICDCHIEKLENYYSYCNYKGIDGQEYPELHDKF